MNTLRKTAYIVVGITALFITVGISAPNTYAQSPIDQVKGGLETSAGTAFGTQNPEAVPLEEVIGNLVNASLALLGVVFMVVLVYAGYLYLTAAGDLEKVKKAKRLLSTSIIGITIVASAYVISFFLLEQLIEVVGGTGGETTQ